VVGIVALYSLCALFASIASRIRFDNEQPTLTVVITGTVERIAGMPIPPDAVLTANNPRRELGGTFDYRTRLRPRQIYEFYYAILTQKGYWRTGSQPLIEESRASFRFFPGTVPRLTLIDVTCTPVDCMVHVDY
jgi:hypothetical protein